MCRKLKRKTKANTVIANITKHTAAEVRFSLGTLSPARRVLGNPLKVKKDLGRERRSGIFLVTGRRVIVETLITKDAFPSLDFV